MFITMLKGKLHRCIATGAELHYEGSIGIDRDLMVASGILANEKVEIYNVTNGRRFSTYVIEEEAGSGAVVVNGAAARLVQKGDHLIICAYALLPLSQAALHVPTVVMLDENNKVKPGKGQPSGR